MNQATTESANPSQQDPKTPRFLIGVRIGDAFKTVLHDQGKLNLKVGTEVMVESQQGIQMGVIASNKIPNIRKTKGEIPRILRVANENDFQAQTRKYEMERHAKKLCIEKIKGLNLAMNLSRVVHLPSQKKTIFYFTAEGRVDFRQLIKELVANLKHRIEMKQVGVRDEARAITGYGVCGEALCCSTFLEEFTPVTIRMAKDQGLALNPSKISGVCGRLMCCLQYEHQIYKEMIKGMPKNGRTVLTPEGPGRVLKNDILGQTVLVRLEDESILTCSMEELKKTMKPKMK
ncbi:MAG: regulatory iron-sulfur-containing complex subunit RicT [Nitrospinaceae bacterium]|nr:regulatory iron-sulfur-containing complex subunit RicT [Nitrospinaceae bacterium]